MIAETVNGNNPGNGTFVEIPNSNHGIHIAATFPEARNNLEPFNPKVAEGITDWLKKQVLP
ncbi:MAG: hypothetical protein SH848_02940 [Saprospiraceae bacterium]|nr:hypothetical protein [Saprospiraceae bacterium]MDZ4702857.1 hypothetical protein [Saprospiraceae bacterium]